MRTVFIVQFIITVLRNSVKIRNNANLRRHYQTEGSSRILRRGKARRRLTKKRDGSRWPLKQRVVKVWPWWRT